MCVMAGTITITYTSGRLLGHLRHGGGGVDDEVTMLSSSNEWPTRMTRPIKTLHQRRDVHILRTLHQTVGGIIVVAQTPGCCCCLASGACVALSPTTDACAHRHLNTAWWCCSARRQPVEFAWSGKFAVSFRYKNRESFPIRLYLFNVKMMAKL